MSKKTRKQRGHRRRTLRRKSKRGGGEIINTNSDSQRITIPASSFKVAAPVNSTDIVNGISKL